MATARTALLGVFTACGQPTAAVDAVAVAFEIQSGGDQLFFPNSMLPERLAARLVDETGTPVQRGGIPVSWEVVAGDGSIIAVDDTTSEQGSVSAEVTLGPTLGTSRFRLTSSDITAVEFAARATLPGPIAFISNRRTGVLGNNLEGFPGDLYVMNEDGSDVVALFSSGFVVQSLFNPKWSPSGESILYSRSIGRPAGGTPGLLRIGLFVINPDGSDESQVPTVGLPEYVRYFAEPTWNADGSKFVVNLAAEGVLGLPPEVIPGALHVVRVSGFGAQPLTNIPGTARAPSWDGVTGRIAFECLGGFTTAICVADENGGNLVTLTDGVVPDTDPAWSSDGVQILFARDTLVGGGIWRMDADGGGLQQVVEGRAMNPSWSPDGNRFVYEWNVDERIDVWLYDFSNNTSINLTNAGSRDSEPAWR